MHGTISRHKRFLPVTTFMGDHIGHPILRNCIVFLDRRYPGHCSVGISSIAAGAGRNTTSLG